jgi:hypothetical protein
MMIATETTIETAEKPSWLVDPATGVDRDGFIYCIDTGEILGHVDATDRFKIESQESADWTLEKRAEIESNIVAIRVRRRAVNEHLKSLEDALIRRLSWWEFRFGSELIAYARTLLKGKSRSVQFAYGKVAWRVTKGRNEILSPTEAIEYVKLYAPEKVKIKESVDIAGVLAAIERAREAGDEDKPNWFVQSGPDENVTISTGIELEGK